MLPPLPSSLICKGTWHPEMRSREVYYHVKGRQYCHGIISQDNCYLLGAFINFLDSMSTVIKETFSFRHKPYYFLVIQSLSHVQLFATALTAACQTSLSFTISQRCSNLCPLSWWCHPTISSSVIPFSSCLLSSPAWGSFPMSCLCIRWPGASASASVLPTSSQGWFPLGLTGLVSLQPKALWRVSNITVQKHQFFSIQPSLWSNSHIHTWLLEKP